MKKKKAGKPSGRSHQKAPSSISVSPSPGPGGEEEGSPETVLADFSRLTHLVVDTSSFILFQELGLLGPLTSHWQCSITEKVLQELERGPNPPAAKDVSGFTIEPSFTVLSAHIPDNHLDPAKKRGRTWYAPYAPFDSFSKHRQGTSFVSRTFGTGPAFGGPKTAPRGRGAKASVLRYSPCPGDSPVPGNHIKGLLCPGPGVSFKTKSLQCRLPGVYRATPIVDGKRREIRFVFKN